MPVEWISAIVGELRRLRLAATAEACAAAHLRQARGLLRLVPTVSPRKADLLLSAAKLHLETARIILSTCRPESPEGSST